MPELVKVEQMMLDFTLEVEQAKLIIRRFDETMTHKAEKVSFVTIVATFLRKETQKATKNEKWSKLKPRL